MDETRAGPLRDPDSMSTLAQERYGRRSTPGRSWLLLTAGALGLAASLAFIGWVTLSGRPTLNWSEIGYSVRSDNEIEITFDVNFSGGESDSDSEPRTAVCTIQALNDLRTEIGLRDVLVPAGPNGRARTTATVQTSERATTGLVKSCARTDE
jgi:hypothetical protein